MAYKVGRCLLPFLLKKRGWTKQDFAYRLNISPSQVSDYISKRKVMSLRTARSAAAILGCHIEDLYEWIEIPEKQSRRGKE